MRVLITGITGFVGSHLAEFLLNRGSVSVLGTRRPASEERNIAAIRQKIRFYDCDLEEADAVERVLGQARPERIFHLAASASVAFSLEHPEETFRTNVLGALHLLETVRRNRMDCRILVAGSSEEYGMADRGEMPLAETAPLRPLSPYAVSKSAQDLLAYQYHRSFGVHTVRTRAFSHTGPRQAENFVAGDFARQIALIEAGRQEPVLRVGNLESVRDFTDVRDVVRGYWLALEKGRPGEVYNICSGKGRAVSEILDIYLKNTSVKIRVEKQPSRMRSNDVPVHVGTAEKFFKQTGWKPEIPFEKTLIDLLNDWRERVAVGQAAAKN